MEEMTRGTCGVLAAVSSREKPALHIILRD
jgi:hypothetical protein